MSDATQKHSLECWAIVELMGHRKLAGYITEEEHFGTNLLRLDVPGEKDLLGTRTVAATQFYSASAIYCITPCTEELARSMAERFRPAPVHRYELPSPQAADPDDHDKEDYS